MTRQKSNCHHGVLKHLDAIYAALEQPLHKGHLVLAVRCSIKGSTSSNQLSGAHRPSQDAQSGLDKRPLEVIQLVEAKLSCGPTHHWARTIANVAAGKLTGDLEHIAKHATGLQKSHVRSG